MKINILALTFMPFFISTAQAWCISEAREGFSVPSRETHIETYECTNHRFPYFSNLNYTIQQGLRCENEAWPSKVVMTCESHSHQTRRVSNVAILCCDENQQ